MRAKRLVQRLGGVNDDRLSWRIEPRCHDLYKLFVLGFLQGSAPQRLELVVVQGAFLDVFFGDVVKVGAARWGEVSASLRRLRLIRSISCSISDAISC